MTEQTTPTNDTWDATDLPDFGQTGFDDFDTEGVDASKIGSGRVHVDKPGYYHLCIEQATARPDRHDPKDMSKSRKPDILLTCVVQCGAPDQCAAGAVYFHNLVLGGKGLGAAIDEHDRNMTLNFLVGVGVLKNVDGRVIDPETGGPKLNTQTIATRLQGRHFIANLKINKGREKSDGSGEKYEDRIGLSYGTGAFQVNDPQVAHVQKNADALSKWIGNQKRETTSVNTEAPNPLKGL